MNVLFALVSGIACGIAAAFGWLMWYFRDVMR